jgi:cyclophilin family peptidyl-prolyl cis-trans isomerase
MPPADKRARKKENARAAREQREAAIKRKKRTRSTITVGVVGIIFIGVIVLISVSGGKSKKAVSTSTSSTSKTATTAKTSTSASTATTAGGPTTTLAPGAAVPDNCVNTVPPKTTRPTYKAPPALTIDTSKTYVAHVDTTCGTFDITLDAKVAPETVNSFVFLAKNHFYDGLDFHRLVKDFVIQGGDPKGDGSGGPGYALPTEPPLHGYQQGSVAMANAGAGTTGSQFFVVVSADGAKGLGGPPYLYSDLGTVTKGFNVIQKLMTFAGPSDGPPTRPLYMFSVTITES